jgi:hypothetical protein
MDLTRFYDANRKANYLGCYRVEDSDARDVRDDEQGHRHKQCDHINLQKKKITEKSSLKLSMG